MTPADWVATGLALLALGISSGASSFRVEFKFIPAGPFFVARTSRLMQYTAPQDSRSAIPGRCWPKSVVVEITEPEEYANARGREHFHIVRVFDRFAGGEAKGLEHPYFAEDFKGWMGRHIERSTLDGVDTSATATASPSTLKSCHKSCQHTWKRNFRLLPRQPLFSCGLSVNLQVNPTFV
ncbi:MAG TPA: hypothetical protein VIW94_06055 [Acidimicrobiia bacterium]